MSEVPDALRLAEMYDFGDPAAHGNAWKSAVCTELRRLHARVQELESIERQLCEQADVVANAYRELESEAEQNAKIIGASAEKELALRALVVELKRYKKAWEDWQDKTEWVQETARPTELGMHRADVLKLRIQKLVNVTLQARIIATSAIRTKSRDKQDWIDDMVAIEEITKGTSE